jgi:hypothetical protein
MSDINDQCSDTSSDLNWPLDHPIEQQLQHDRVVFENVPDQYVKGEDVTAFFTVLQDSKINPDEDQIGLLRIGCTNIKECFAYAAVQFNPSTTSGSIRHGTATFSSASLPATDDEFYQFCYIINQTKNLGSSIPFQLNCALDDIDLLSNAPVGKSKGDGIIALADRDNDDIVIIHTKRMLTEEKLRQENRQLLDSNHRLELQNDESQAKFNLLEIKTNEHINKINNEMQTLTASHKIAIGELSSRQQSELKLRNEYDACRSLCAQYQSECLQHAERCRTLEDAHTQVLNDAKQIRSQLAVTSQLTKDQATQVIDLERRLMQSNELSKTANQRQSLLEQQLRDLRLTSEKHQISSQAQLDNYSKQVAEKDEHINKLQADNDLLKDEIHSLQANNELSQELQQQLDQLREQHRLENELKQNEIESLQTQINEINLGQQAYAILKNSFTEVEKRCVKHQKSEIEVKRQLSVYQNFVNDLQREIQELTERLSAGADEYRTLFRKYTALERTVEMNQQQEKQNPTTILTNEHVPNDEELIALLRNSSERQEEKQDAGFDEERNSISTRASLLNLDAEVHQCPMCYWEFPLNMTVEKKTEHIEGHFQ